ncbi:MAG: DUF1674 domain-containing protein [Oceanococcaceae bacterium]
MKAPDHKPAQPAPTSEARQLPVVEKPKEVGGPKGPEPTRFGDWERKGRCIDF